MGLDIVEYLAAFEHLAHTTCRLYLSEMGSYGMHRVGERFDAPVEGVEAHGGNFVGPFAQSLCLKQAPYGEGTHVLCTVEQGQTFL